MERRSEFVRLAESIGSGEASGSMSELCRRYGISRKTGYKWLERHQKEGSAGLADRSRAPRRQPHKTCEPVEERVLALREHHPGWGGRKLRRRLLDLGETTVPAASSITEILRRHGQLEPATGAGKPGAPQRFERERPNDLWQMDFKGHFGLAGGGRCHPLTVTDDHSRFNILLAACGEERSQTVKERLIGAFECYGLPRQILCDNATIWGCPKRRQGLSGLEAWLTRVGVEVIHGRPYHPQTQGKGERFHQTLNHEVISRRVIWRDLGQCDEAFCLWRVVYNEQRPHEALGNATPVSRYEVSARSYGGEREMAACYEPGVILRKVDRSGEISFRALNCYVGMGLAGETVGLRQVGERQWSVSYGWKCLGLTEIPAEKTASSMTVHLSPMSW
jgi:transposase InsO family protein